MKLQINDDNGQPVTLTPDLSPDDVRHWLPRIRALGGDVSVDHEAAAADIKRLFILGSVTHAIRQSPALGQALCEAQR
jgi:hypothetical protein